MPMRALQVTQLYRLRIPENAVIVDLMSSWVSHLPPDKKYKRVVGHGMNAAEVRHVPEAMLKPCLWRIWGVLH